MRSPFGRAQPPVHSPVDPASLASAALVAIRGDDGTAHERARAAIARRFDSAAVVLTDSGTSALTLALRIAAGPGGLVAMPAYACIDLATAAQGAGVRVVLYDLEPTTLSPDPISLGEAIAAGAAAVVVVHLFGYPVDVDAVREVAGSAVIVEDAAQAAGGRLRGRSLGALGDLAVLSFGRGKGMSAGGGGALLAVNGSWASAIRDAAGMLEAGGGGAMAVAMSLAQWVLARPALFAIPSAIPQLRLGEMIYHEPGAVREMSDASAYLVPRAIELSEAAVAGRQRVAVQLTGACAGGLAFVEPLADSQPGFLRLAVRVASGVRAPYSLGVVRPYPVSLADHAAMQAVLQERRDAPGARELAAELVTLPTHEYLDSGDIARVSEWLVEAGNGGARANATFSGSESSS